MIVSEIPQQSQNRLIQVSDDEEESDEESVIDSDDDIDSDTTTESGDSDEEEENDLGQQSGGSTNVDEIKKVNIKEILGDSVEQLNMLEEDTDAKIVDTENKVINLTKHIPENDDSSEEDDSDLGRISLVVSGEVGPYFVEVFDSNGFVESFSTTISVFP